MSIETFNDLDMANWKEYGDLITDSLWLLGPRDKTGPHAGDFHGNFVPQIPRQVIQRFTKLGEVVVDLFSGMGTTLIECRYLGRHGVGVELQKEVNLRARERIDRASNPDLVSTYLLTGDSRLDSTRDRIESKLDGVGYRHAHHIILHPPYWNIIRFSNGNPSDLSSLPDLATFYTEFGRVARQAFNLLQPGRFMTLVIGDKYARGEWIPLGFGCMQACQDAGFRLKAINVKDVQGNEKSKGKASNLWRYRALKGGFYLFKHEYVMVFQKRGQGLGQRQGQRQP